MEMVTRERGRPLWSVQRAGYLGRRPRQRADTGERDLSDLARGEVEDHGEGRLGGLPARRRRDG